MGAGSIRKRGDVWQLRAPSGTDPVTGKRTVITETFRGSEKQASLRLAEQVKGNRRRRTGGNANLGDVITRYMAQRRLATSTVQRKLTPALAHMPPRYLKLQVDRMNGQHLDMLYDQLAGEGVGSPTIRTLHGLISASCGQAVKWGLIERNPAALATPPPEQTSVARAPTLDENRALVAALKPDNLQHQLWLRIHMATGARSSEVIGLHWSDIVPPAKTIQFARTIERGPDRREQPTKNRRKRTFQLDDSTLALVKRWQTAQRERAFAAGARLVKDPYLFSHDLDSSQPWNAESPGQIFERLRERADVHVRLHDLRHGAASAMFADGLDPITVAYRLGDDPRTVLKVYAHMINERDVAAAAAIGRALDALG